MSHEVILINPPQVFTKNQVASGITPPLGIAYLASVLELHDITVDIIDSVGLEPQTIHPFEKETFVRGLHFGDIVARLDDEVKIVGISNLFSFAYPVVQELCRQIRAFRSDIKIVLGGPHPSALYEEVLIEEDDPHPDMARRIESLSEPRAYKMSPRDSALVRAGVTRAGSSGVISAEEAEELLKQMDRWGISAVDLSIQSQMS